jgi:GntR family transcriptional repressor for pyruvate dehydrogenase complex
MRRATTRVGKQLTMADTERTEGDDTGFGGGGLRLARETLADRMTTQLRQQILSGRLNTGDLLPTERELREAFGVSRTTVREALHGLVTSGFLERRSNQLYVRDRRDIPEREIDYGELAARHSVEDVYETRKALESKAVELAARNWVEGDMELLRAVLDKMRGAGGATYHAADVEFHTTIVHLSRNTVLEQVYEESKHLFFRLPSFWRVFGAQGAGQAEATKITGWEGHLPIVEAIERRDAAEAVRLNTDLLDQVATTLIGRMAARARAAEEAVTPG